ncbi:MAG: RNA-binding domain-containing protein [Ktedonobacteraceae bacterium]
MANLPELIAAGESQTLEFKRTFTEEVLETISAFANADGGIILIGVDDDGTVPGIDVGRKTLEDYANRIQVAIDPRLQPAMNVIAVTEKQKQVVQLKVPQATSSAVSANGRFFKRAGKTNQRMSGEEIAQKLMSSMKLSWDSGIEAGGSIDDLDTDTINRFVELVEKSNRRPLPKESDPIVTLEKLELIVNRQPTRAALLLFGKRPQQYFQSAFIKLGRFKSEVHIVDDRELNGNIIAQVEEAMGWFRDHLQGEVVVEGTANRRIDWEYPLDAVREAVANAVCHRDYKSDAHSQIRLYDTKLEFWNPGNLPPGISVDDLLKEHESRPRSLSEKS